MSKNSKRSALLDNIIKILIILLLLGGLLVVTIIATDKLKTENSNKKISIKKERTKKVEINSTNSSVTQKKVYSQDEMQEIVQMMMDQMQELNKSKDDESTKLSVDSTEEIPSDSELLAILQAADIEEDDDDTLTQSEDKNEESKADDSEDKVDHYNKVVISDSTYSEKNLDALTQKIGNIVEDMSAHKTTKTAYTQNISKEVTTRVDEMRVIVVKRGDTLSKIALRAYGKVSGYHRLVEANRDLIKNPNHIYVGQRLRVPTL